MDVDPRFVEGRFHNLPPVESNKSPAENTKNAGCRSFRSTAEVTRFHGEMRQRTSERDPEPR